MSILNVKNLCKQYGSGEVVTKALDNVNLSEEEGKPVTTICASAMEKSTLLYLVDETCRPSGGKSYVDNKASRFVRNEVQS